MGTETWLSSKISNSEIFPKGYNVVRQDRNDGYGDVLLALKNNIDHSILVTSASESVFVEVKSIKDSSIIIGTLYRPPNSDLLYAENMCSKIEEIVNANKNSVVYLGGDLNLPDIE